MPVGVSAAEGSPQQYSRGDVISVEEYTETVLGTPGQRVQIEVLSGEKAGEQIEIIHGADFTLQDHQRVHAGDVVVLATIDQAGEQITFIVGPYRVPALGWIALFFVVLVWFLGRRNGIASVIGLALTVFVLLKMVIPWMIGGMSPLTAILLGGGIISIVSLYIAHGINTRTSVALSGTLITLGLSIVFAWVFVITSHLFGFGSEEILFLQSDLPGGFDFRGLLLGGIILGTLGVLDDITTGQSAAVDEIHKANPRLGVVELYKRGLSVGREHIASLVNTLFLAYAGVSFPILMLFSLNEFQPWWVIISNETIAEEIVRTLVGSTALVLAVPITTLIAAVVFGGKSSEKE